MAQKRSAGRQLTQDNWDDDEAAPEPEDVGTATPEVLANRVIRTAKRRNRNQPEEKRGIFSGFGGFAKTPSAPSAPSNAFGFISNLANGNSNDNKPFSFMDKIVAQQQDKKDEPDNTKPFSFMDKIAAQQKDKKDEPDNAKPFSFMDKIVAQQDKKDQPEKSKPFSFMDKISAEKKETANNEKTFGFMKNVSQSPQTISTTTDPVKKLNTSENNVDKEKLEYYTNLKSLNLGVSEWIKSHVDKNPYCILTPVFDDYIKHLKEIEKLKPAEKSNIEEPKKAAPIRSPSPVTKDRPVPASTPSTFSGTPKNNTHNEGSLPSSPFGGIFNQFTSTPVTQPAFPGEKTSPAPTPFSFGGAKPFSFGAGALAAPPAVNFKAADEEEETDEPPKVSFTPVIEEDNVYSKRCKVFVKKDDNFTDRGVGTLFIKPIKDSEKYQLIVRADTSLGNLLLNLVLSDAIPTQRTGKNNVMLVCIPNADATPPPVPTLIRVKSAEEADELLATLNKFKK